MQHETETSCEPTVCAHCACCLCGLLKCSLSVAAGGHHTPAAESTQQAPHLGDSVVLTCNGREERLRLINNKISVNAVKEAFNLKSVQLDGQLEPVDQVCCLWAIAHMCCVRAKKQPLGLSCSVCLHLRHVVSAVPRLLAMLAFLQLGYTVAEFAPGQTVAVTGLPVAGGWGVRIDSHGRCAGFCPRLLPHVQPSSHATGRHLNSIHITPSCLPCFCTALNFTTHKQQSWRCCMPKLQPCVPSLPALTMSGLTSATQLHSPAASAA